MVTTRSSSTYSSPAESKPSSKKRKPSKQNRLAALPQENGRMIGDDDKFSKLPYEILCMIWNYCHSPDLVQLCRANRTFRAYLTAKTSKTIWIDARARMSVTAQVSWPTYRLTGAIDPYAGQSWPRNYTIPDPPPYLTEIDWAAFLYETQCRYCNAESVIKTYGTYQAACQACTRDRQFRIDQLKQVYASKNVDNRFYSILPHYIVQQYTRMFWKPTCDRLQQGMAEFELRVDRDELAIQDWIEARRQIINEHMEGKATQSQVAIWQHAHDYGFSLQLDAVRKRNTAMFLHCMEERVLHCMEETCFDPADLQAFCRMGPNALWLMSDAIIFDIKAALEDVRNCADQLSEIRAYRRKYEAHQELKPATEVLKKLLARSLAYAVSRGKTVWNFNYLKHLPDVMSLPSVTPIIQAVAENADAGQVYALWESLWDDFCDDMLNLEAEWNRIILMLIVGGKRAMTLDTSAISPVFTAFSCSNIQCLVSTTLYYPALLDHECFRECADGSDLNDACPRDSIDMKRGMPTNLDALRYQNVKSKKLSIVQAALKAAGGVYYAIETRPDLDRLRGDFRCLDCPEDEREVMSWREARDHVCEKTYFRELQEDGERVLKSKEHLQLEYIPGTAE